MTLREAEKLAWRLLGHFDLHNWSFKWMRRNTFNWFGLCRAGRKTIYLSREYVQAATDEQVEDTIRHEIAHAIDYERNGKGGHGASWKKICIEVGAIPKRAHKHIDFSQFPAYQARKNKQSKPRYQVVHKLTGRVYISYYRKPKNRNWSTSWIIGKKDETRGKLQLVKVA